MYVVIVSDAAPVRDDVRAAITDPDVTVRELTAGKQLLPAVQEQAPDLAVVDLQIGNMGGMAACLDLRLEEGMERLPHVPVLMLLDRREQLFSCGELTDCDIGVSDRRAHVVTHRSRVADDDDVHGGRG